jgi:hypothetical protein
VKNRRVSGLVLSLILCAVAMASLLLLAGQPSYAQAPTYRYVAYGGTDDSACTDQLEHIPREEHEIILRRIHHWLRPGGLLLIGTEAADVDEAVSEWLGVPMYFSSFDSEAVKRWVDEVGFEIVETAIETQVEQGKEIPYLWLLARKP